MSDPGKEMMKILLMLAGVAILGTAVIIYLVIQMS